MTDIYRSSLTLTDGIFMRPVTGNRELTEAWKVENQPLKQLHEEMLQLLQQLVPSPTELDTRVKVGLVCNSTVRVYI